MKCPFVVGQRVVCINSVWYQSNPFKPNYGGLIKGPVKNSMYNISEINVSDLYPEQVYLTLKECGDFWWNSKSFRPLNERPSETSIEVFKKLLNPANHKQLENV